MQSRMTRALALVTTLLLSFAAPAAAGTSSSTIQVPEISAQLAQPLTSSTFKTSRAEQRAREYHQRYLERKVARHKRYEQRKRERHRRWIQHKKERHQRWLQHKRDIKLVKELRKRWGHYWEALRGWLRSISQCESHGDADAVSEDGRYRGKYQFSFQTWGMVGGEGDPADAPEPEQDLRAARLLATGGPGHWPNCA